LGLVVAIVKIKSAIALSNIISQNSWYKYFSCLPSSNC